MGRTTFTGPMWVGPKKYAEKSDGTLAISAATVTGNQGTVMLAQTGSLVFGNTTDTLLPIFIPKGATICEVSLSGSLTGTAPTVSIGTTAADNELVNAQSFTTGTAAFVPNPTAGTYFTGGQAVLAADTQLRGKIGGSALSAGTIKVIVQYIQGDLANGAT